MSVGSNPALCDLITGIISQTEHQRITFAEYMELVLYHPQHGYYATGAANMGKQGDFFTSSHLGADFGELLAEQFVEMWEILGSPTPFTLVEMGAGQGLVAADILRYLHSQHIDFFDNLEYIILEKAPGMIAQQQQLLQDWVAKWGRLYWRTLEEMPVESIVGCCFSNELVDALPVHRIAIELGQLREIYVTTGTGERQFVEVTDYPQPGIAEYFELVGIKFTEDIYPDGYRTEVNLAALDWISKVGERLKRGYLLTIDYGYPATRYYIPWRRQGTLQCYYHHMHHDEPYINIGHQDITAHVDFTALERQGELCSLQRVGFTQQGLFLMALGLGERLAALSSSENQSIQQILHRRDILHQLIGPMGLGSFGVLVQSKGLSESEKQHELKGLTIPNR